MKIFLSILSFLFVLVSCNSDIKESEKKEIILKADREAPLGWVYLEIYKDTSFKFTSTGLIKPTHFLGKASIINDTIYFEYTDSIPRAGKIAVIKDNNISYIASKYPENLGISLNKLDEEKKYFNMKNENSVIIDTVYSGDYYDEEVKNKKGISLNLLNEKDLEKNDGQWCFSSDKDYYFKIEVHGVSKSATLETIVVSEGLISEIDTLKKTFRYKPPQKNIIVNIDYSIELDIISINRKLDKSENIGYKENVIKIDGLYGNMNIQVCN